MLNLVWLHLAAEQRRTFELIALVDMPIYVLWPRRVVPSPQSMYL